MIEYTQEMVDSMRTIKNATRQLMQALPTDSKFQDVKNLLENVARIHVQEIGWQEFCSIAYHADH